MAEENVEIPEGVEIGFQNCSKNIPAKAILRFRQLGRQELIYTLENAMSHQRPLSLGHRRTAFLTKIPTQKLRQLRN